MNRSKDMITIPELEEAPDIKFRKKWDPKESEIVKTYFGRKDPVLIAAAINKRFHTDRTPHAVQQHARKLKEMGQL